MYNSVVEDVPLPLSPFHPRWHFDGLAVLKNRWVMSWDLEQEVAPAPSLNDRHAGDRYVARGLQMAEESALAVLDKLKSLPPGMAEAFANSFATGAERLLVQQDKMLESQQEFPTTLPAPLVEETPLLYRKGKRRAITGLEVAEERERDASRQWRRDEREAAARAMADIRQEAREEERREEQEMMAADWVADTQLQFSQLSYEDNAEEDQQLADPLRHSSLEDASEEAFSSDLELSDQSFDAGPRSQRQPLEISSDDSDQEPSNGE
jgi:hypothetical protein